MTSLGQYDCICLSPVCKLGSSYTCLQARAFLYLYARLVLLYLYASPDDPIPVCKPACYYINARSDAPMFVCKPGCSYACMQATMLLYPLLNQRVRISRCRLGCPNTYTQACLPLCLYACPGVPIPVCKPKCHHTVYKPM